MLSYPDPELAAGHVRLRKWRDDDLHCVEEAAGDAGIAVGTTVPTVFDVAAGRAFVRRQWSRAEDGSGISLAITDGVTDEALGLVFLGVRPQPGVVGVGYWLLPRARGRGMATTAVALVTEWAIRDRGAARVEAWVEPHNDASQRVLAAVGFRHEGLLRSYLSFPSGRADVLVFSRIASDR